MLTDLPNVLTLARIAAIPFLVAFVAERAAWSDVAACVVFAAAAVTDLLDGMIARRRGQTSDLGRMLDPIADKLLVGATILMLAGTGRLGRLGLYAALLILLREILVSGLREFLAGRSSLAVTNLAKIKTCVQMVALGVLLAGDSGAELLGLDGFPATSAGAAMLWIAAGLTLITGSEYLMVGLRAVRPSGPGQASGNPSGTQSG